MLCTTQTCGCTQVLSWHSLVFMMKTAAFRFRVKICLIDKVAGFFKTVIPTYQTRRFHIPEDRVPVVRPSRLTAYCCSHERVSCSRSSKPTAALDRPEGSRRLRIPDFKTVGTRRC